MHETFGPTVSAYIDEREEVWRRYVRDIVAYFCVTWIISVVVAFALGAFWL